MLEAPKSVYNRCSTRYDTWTLVLRLLYAMPLRPLRPPDGSSVREESKSRIRHLNSTIPGVEEADVILLVGTNPRHEAAVLNSRIRKSWLHTPLEVGLVGERVELSYGKGEFAKKFNAAKKPLIIVGSAGTEHADSAPIHGLLVKLVG
ncbi:hypothetical protein EV122DRAFT_283990 [Schizophyllum commune]